MQAIKFPFRARFASRSPVCDRLSGVSLKTTRLRPSNSRFVCNAKPKDPTVIHFFENVTESPAFPNFTEGLYHVMEVARDHPLYKSSQIHEIISTEEDKVSPFSYVTLASYNPCPEGSEALWQVDEGYQIACKYGVKDPHHQVIAERLVTLPEGAPDPLAVGAVADEDLVVLAAFVDVSGPDALTLTQALMDLPAARSVCLYKSVEDATDLDEPAFSCCLRTVIGGEADVDELAKDVGRLTKGVQGLMHAGVYRVLFECTKDGSSVGIIAAQKATDLAKQRGMGSAQE